MFTMLLDLPTKTRSIWEARKVAQDSAGTQNLRHSDKFGGAGGAQASANWRRGGAGLAQQLTQNNLYEKRRNLIQLKVNSILNLNFILLKLFFLRIFSLCKMS